MTRPPDPRPEPVPGPRPEERPGPETCPLLDGDAALDLLLASTNPGQTVLDLDDDPVLRAAAGATGRRYRTVTRPLRAHEVPGAGREPAAHLVVLAWPRPDNPRPGAGRDALTFAATVLARGGRVAVLLDPAVPQAYTVTWTGAVLTVARTVGLDYLQDIVCLNTTREAGDGADDEETPVAAFRQRHRVVLLLRRPAGSND